MLLICLLILIALFFRPKIVVKIVELIFSLPFIKKWKTNALKTAQDVEIAAYELKHERKGFWLKSFLA